MFGIVTEQALEVKLQEWADQQRRDLDDRDRKLRNEVSDTERRISNRIQNPGQTFQLSNGNITIEELERRILDKLEVSNRQAIREAVQDLDLSDIADRFESDVDMDTLHEALARAMVATIQPQVDKQEVAIELARLLLDEDENYLDLDDLRQDAAERLVDRLEVSITKDD